MTVKELIEKLQKCNQDAIVCAEANRDPLVNEVQEYVSDEDGVHYVYVADELDYIDEVFIGKRIKEAT